MFLLNNKRLFLGAVAVVIVWLAVYFVAVRDNWATAAAKLEDAEKVRAKWESYYSTDKGLLPKIEAEKALNDNKAVLNKNLTDLRKIELGTRETLHEFTEAAAGAADKRSYFDQKRITIANRANDTLHIPTPPGLGILGEKAVDEPVSVNLLRLAMVEAVIAACKKVDVPSAPRIVKFQHLAPRLILAGDEDDAAAEPSADEPKDAKAKAAKPDAGPRRLVQFPMKVVLQLEEEQLGKLLFELAKPTEGSHRSLCLRGFHISVKDSGSDKVEAAVAVVALLNESFVCGDLGIELKQKAPVVRRVDGY